MSIVYRIDKSIGASFVVWDGEVTPQQFIDHTQQLIADPGWPAPGYIQISDLQTFRNPHLLPDETIEQVVDLWAARRDDLARMRLAVVAAAAFEKSKLFEMMIARYGITLIVFNDLGTACIWLGIDVEKSESVLNALRAEARAGQQP